MLRKIPHIGCAGTSNRIGPVSVKGSGPAEMPLDDAISIARTRIVDEVDRETGSLSFRGLPIDALPEELAGLTALQHLDCSYTQLRDLAPLKDLVALQYLICIFARVSDLTPLNYLVALRYRNCVGTQVSDL